MEVEDKLETLVGAAKFDVCGYSGMHTPAPSPLRFIHRAALPGGGSVCLFKVLLTNVCTNDCAYCVNRIGRDIRRTSFQPEELARLFMQLYQKRLVRGLFLSSGVAANPSRTMESKPWTGGFSCEARMGNGSRRSGTKWNDDLESGPGRWRGNWASPDLQ